MIPARFAIARLPRIVFGRGCLRELPELLKPYGNRLLIVTGAGSFNATAQAGELFERLRGQGFAWELYSIAGEPSPELIDNAVAGLADRGWDAIVGIGGGSALDTAKALAGLLPVGRSVLDYLEGVGPEFPYPGPALPLIAVPTTAGTGSEATKNAVLSRQGPDGFKKSFRDDRLVPAVALVDPDLLATCPPAVIAANGMDALTQLIESYVSSRANPFCDALGIDALARARESLPQWYEQGAGARDAQERMAYAALVSGINLAQTGLGAVHGLASPLGAFFPIPHGVVCGTLVAEATAVNIDALREREPDNPALARYARIAETLLGRPYPTPELAQGALIELLRRWTQQLRLPRLGELGVEVDAIPQIVANARGSSMRTNPILLSDGEIAEIVLRRL